MAVVGCLTGQDAGWLVEMLVSWLGEVLVGCGWLAG